MILNSQKFDETFVCYEIRDVADAVTHIGIASAPMLTLFEGVNLPDGRFTVEILKQDSDLAKIATFADGHARTAGRPEFCAGILAFYQSRQKGGNRTRVLCVDTGEIFESAAAAARRYNIPASNMSSHLNGAAGYKRLGGRTFIKMR